ncbi:MFS general substrate transporter [Byssothecium circinans]|uniref:MFS general substrate transporter n=1 Tax=Byssothecium circinans TaxID=147558 RepID=A0A6A5UCV3_9PLEO|nr:MFS general substrate transporter [Byssothecium circinans]
MKDDQSEDRQNKGNCGQKITRQQQVRSLVAASIANFWVIGLTQSFGIFQRHYGSAAAVKDGVVRAADITFRARIATVGSLGNGGIMSVFSLLWMPYLPLLGGHIKMLCAVGTILISVGFGVAATSTQLWILLLTQGLMVGLGAGIFISTLQPILADFFGRRVGLAQGISLASASAGGVALSISIPELLDAIGSRATLGVLASISAALGTLVSLLAQPPRKYERRNTNMVPWSIFRKPIFTLLFIVSFIHPLTLANPMTFGPDFSATLGFTKTQGSLLLACMNAVGLLARLGIGWMVDNTGQLNMLLIAMVVYGMGTWGLWLSAAHTNSKALWIAFSVTYGLVNGTYNTVINSLQKKLFGNEDYYSINGATASIRGAGYVLGVPLAGALVASGTDDELSPEDFTRPIVYNGALLTIGVACLAGVRILDARQTGWAWKR